MGIAIVERAELTGDALRQIQGALYEAELWIRCKGTWGAPRDDLGAEPRARLCREALAIVDTALGCPPRAEAVV